MCGKAANIGVCAARRPASPRVRSTRISMALPWVTLLLQAVTSPPGDLVGAELARLPPVRLPLVDANLPAADIPAALRDGDDIVRLAGGAVELRVRQGWWIWEVPQGREVRIALSPTRPASLKTMPAAGHWVCFHVGTSDSADSRQFLSDQMRQRLAEVSAGQAAPLNSIQFHRLGLWDAAEIEFSLPADGAAGRAPIHGSHVLVRTPWGLFEFHSQFPADRYQQQTHETARLLRQVVLTAPRVMEPGPTSAETDAAAPIHGSWKAFRSRLRLRPNGGIEIATDRPQLISPPEAEEQPVRSPLLRGRYRADGDLLYVQWQDGSKLNFRWKLNGGDLLLTDHDGQISQLRRIAE